MAVHVGLEKRHHDGGGLAVNELKITRPCPRESCGGTLVPSPNPSVYFDWDGSGGVATECSRRCGMQSFTYFSWDPPEHDEEAEAS